MRPDRPGPRILTIALLFALARLTLVAGSLEATPCTEPGLFAAPVPLTTLRHPLFMATGDFNEDGLVDFAVTSGDLQEGSPGTGHVGIHLGTGPRSWAPAVLHRVGDDAIGVVAADFNADDITDLAVANRASGTVSILIGLGSGGIGNGSFAPAAHHAAGDGPFQLQAADLDRDGITDLAVSNNIAYEVSVLRGLGSGGVGNGSFGPRTAFPLQSYATGIEVADFDENGIPDLVVSEHRNARVVVFRGTGSPTLGSASFGPGVGYAAGPQPFDIEVADFDEDGHADLAAANSVGAGTEILRGGGDGTFEAVRNLPSGNGAGLIAVDVNQDGIMDLVVSEASGYDTGDIKLFLGQGIGGDGDGSFAAPRVHLPMADAYQFAAGDFDGDGFKDLLVSSYRRDYVSLLPGMCGLVPPDPPDPRKPVLTDVRDVPSDQGGKVFVTWDASSLDVSDGAVVSYRLWRRIHPDVAMSATLLASDEFLATRGAGTAAVEYWEALATLPAQRLPGYGYTAATTQDSTRRGNRYTAFFVTALTSGIDVFYSSEVDSGYSVDNIRPRRPGSLTSQVGPTGLILRWEENDDQDLAGYRLYRGATADFSPSEANRIAALGDLEYVDATGTGADYYKLSAVDEHGNESEFAVLGPSAPTSVGGTDMGFGLHGVWPNPSYDGELTIDFALMRGGPARLEILDLGGRRVAVRKLHPTAGPQSFGFRGAQRLPIGAYVVRLVQGVRSQEVKAIVVR